MVSCPLSISPWKRQADPGNCRAGGVGTGGTVGVAGADSAAISCSWIQIPSSIFIGRVSMWF